MNRLITIPISHFCEKARWALERAEIPYTEHAHMQGLHSIAARRAGGGRTVPVLVCPDRVLSESSEILRFADEHTAPGRRLYPADEHGTSEIRELERNFDELLGPDGRLWLYDALRGNRELVLAYGTTGVPAWQRRMLPLALKPMTRLIDRVLDVTPQRATAAEHTVRESFDAVAARLGDGRPYLMGDRFTAADLTFAALAAAVTAPPQYGVPLPQPDVMPARMRTFVEECRAHPAGRHALRMFREERHARGVPLAT